jgi:hypothetical protein
MGFVLWACRSRSDVGPTRDNTASDPKPTVRDGALARGGHALVVGGTGMLAPVSMELARRGYSTTVIARSSGPLGEMAAASGGRIFPLQVDYHDAKTLEAGLRRAIDARGSLSLVIAWIHGSATQAPTAVARIAAEGGPVRYLHVLGSAADDPSLPDQQRRTEFEAIHGVTYEEVILGFIRAHGVSRWLTDDEISDGVLAAIDDPAPRRIVGVTRPWSARP